jgi:hypothetical protein
VAGLFREENTAGWWLISQTNRLNVTRIQICSNPNSAVDKVARCPHGTCEVKDKVLVINNGDEQLGLWLTVRKAHVLLALQPIMSLPLGQPYKPRGLFRPGTRRCSADDFVFFFLTILVVLPMID